MKGAKSVRYLRHKRPAVLVAILALSALLVTACGGGGSQQTTQQPQQQEQASSSTQQQSSQPAPAPAAAGPVTLIWGRGGDTVGLDPINVTDGESFKVINQIYDTLVRYQPGKTDVEPSLATEWSWNEDGTEWTFKLRQGVKFHDGTEFNAEAVKFNFDRWRDSSNPYHKGGDFGYYVYMFGGFDDDSVIQDVQVVDPYTVKFVLRRPQAPFLSNLAMPMFAIASPKAVMADPEGFTAKPVGTGPFKFVDWKKGDTVTLEANPDYWDGKPQIDRLIFRSIPDNNARLLALQSGDIDVMDGVTPQNLAVAQAMGKFDVHFRPAMNVGYLAMNTEKKPFDNPLVRQAINHAINKEAIIKAFYAGLGEPAQTAVPPVMWSHKKTFNYDYNPDKAKELLAQAGYPNGFETDLWAMPVPRPYMPQPTDIAVALINDLKKVGINARIVSYDWGTYLDKTGRGEHSMALLGWIGDNGDPDNFLYVLLDKDNAKGPDAGNIAFYKNDELHDILIEAQQNPDKTTRTKLYEQAQEIIAKDAPWVPLAHARAPIIMKKGITGYVPSPTGSEPLAKVKVSQ